MSEVATAAVGVALVVASASKMYTWREFVSVAEQYAQVAGRLPRTTAGLIVCAEASVGVAILLVDWLRFVALTIGLAMLFGFFVVQCVVRFRGVQIRCGCFPVWRKDETVGAASIMRTGVLSGLAVIALIDPPARLGAVGVGLGAALIVVVLMAAELAAIVMSSNSLNLPPMNTMNASERFSGIVGDDE